LTGGAGAVRPTTAGISSYFIVPDRSTISQSYGMFHSTVLLLLALSDDCYRPTVRRQIKADAGKGRRRRIDAAIDQNSYGAQLT
jgi:hypothetical protein